MKFQKVESIYPKNGTGEILANVCVNETSWVRRKLNTRVKCVLALRYVQSINHSTNININDCEPRFVACNASSSFLPNSSSLNKLPNTRPISILVARGDEFPKLVNEISSKRRVKTSVRRIVARRASFLQFRPYLGQNIGETGVPEKGERILAIRIPTPSNRVLQSNRATHETRRTIIKIIPSARHPRNASPRNGRKCFFVIAKPVGPACTQNRCTTTRVAP